MMFSTLLNIILVDFSFQKVNAKIFRTTTLIHNEASLIFYAMGFIPKMIEKGMKHFLFFSDIINKMENDNQRHENGNYPKKVIIYYLLMLFSCINQDVFAKSPLRIVGSSAVFPFAATVAEHFSYKTHEPIPLVEAIGTGTGIKLFCGNINGADGVITSRSFTEKEVEKCKQNDIRYEKFIIGIDGLVLIQNKKNEFLSLTIDDLNQALFQKILKQKACVKNQIQTWKDIQNNFPPNPIRILGPASNSGTYDILIEKTSGICGPFIRQDGIYVETAANENLIIQKVLSTRKFIGIITFSFYDQNKTRLQGLSVNGILPTFESIQKKEYPLSRPLYLYIKTNDLKLHPARQTYTLEFISSQAIGDKGYLTKKGLIPLSPREQKIMQERALNLKEKENS